MHIEKMAVAVSRNHARAVMPNDHIYCFNKQENILNYVNVFLIRRNHLFYAQINELVRRASEAGLISKWAKDYYQQKVKIKKDSKVTAIHLEHFLGIFIICGSILSLAVLIAIIEPIVYNKARDKNGHYLWKKISEIIDGQRHTLLIEKHNSVPESQIFNNLNHFRFMVNRKVYRKRRKTLIISKFKHKMIMKQRRITNNSILCLYENNF